MRPPAGQRCPLLAALSPHLGSRLLLLRDAPATRAWALDELSALLAAPVRACPHAAEGTAIPLVAAAWTRGLSCLREECLASAIGIPRRPPCSRCGRRRGGITTVAIPVGRAMLLATLCRRCLLGLHSQQR